MSAEGDDLTGGAVRVIRTAGDPVLEHVCERADPADPALLGELCDMAATLADFRARVGFGRAIAAPQVGVAKRMLVVNLGDGPQAVLNPEITWRSDETQWVWDDCLSVPDTLVRVERAASITVAFTDHRGRPQVWERLPADRAELLQHEIDHLDGLLMTARAASEADVRSGAPTGRFARPG